MAPIVKIGRKLSRKEDVEDRNGESDSEEYATNYQDIVDAGLKIPEEFISEMIEAFTLFDKVSTHYFIFGKQHIIKDKNGFLCSKELGSILRTLGRNPTEKEVTQQMKCSEISCNFHIL